jgi:hypothetical protein
VDIVAAGIVGVAGVAGVIAIIHCGFGWCLVVIAVVVWFGWLLLRFYWYVLEVLAVAQLGCSISFVCYAMHATHHSTPYMGPWGHWAMGPWATRSKLRHVQMNLSIMYNRHPAVISLTFDI